MLGRAVSSKRSIPQLLASEKAIAGPCPREVLLVSPGHEVRRFDDLHAEFELTGTITLVLLKGARVRDTDAAMVCCLLVVAGAGGKKGQKRRGASSE